MMKLPYYGAVGNGETVALISPELSVDWLCVPRADTFPVFARALDPKNGGSLTLSWGLDESYAAIPGEPWQYYRPRTNILETGAICEGIQLVVSDFMPWSKRYLTRRITLTNLSGEPQNSRLSFSLTPTRSQVAPAGQESLLYGGFKGLTADCVARPDGSLVIFLGPGESQEVSLILAYGESPEEARANWEQAGTDELAQEERFWQEWLAPARPVASGDATLDEAYYRSLLALKLLCQEKSGAILAAPTASFPAIPGGGDNWDYRFSWLRDGYFISRALDAAGLHTESRRFYDLALKFQEPDGRWRQTLYTVDGGNPVEYEAPDMTGPGGETPVRFGNAASTQVQIDSEPNVLHGLYLHWKATRDDRFIADRWEQIRLAAGAVMHTWKLQENGIWEIRERIDHWVYGKALCAAGLQAAAAMGAALGHVELAARWAGEAEQIRQDVIEGGWSEERQAYLQTYDDRSPIDISALALSLWGLLPAGDPRLTATVTAMMAPLKRPELPERHAYTTDTPAWGVKAGGLNMWGGLARYDYAAVPFYLPTLWMARHQLRAGDRKQALSLLRLCLASATTLGLMAEHFDPRTGGQWGNFPQGFSHEETALALLELFGRPAYEEKGSEPA